MRARGLARALCAALALLGLARGSAAQIPCPLHPAAGPLSIALAVNGGADVEAFVGVGAYFELAIVRPPGAAGPLALADASGSWAGAASIEVRDASGALQAWPLELVPGAGPTLSLPPDASAQLIWTLSPQASAALPPGEYSLTGVFEPQLPLPPGAWCGSAQSRSARLNLVPEPPLSTRELRERKHLIGAEVAALRGDPAAAEAAIDALLALDASSSAGQRLKADLAARRGQLQPALAGAEAAVRAALATAPGTEEIPSGALQFQAELLARAMNQSGSLGAPALTLSVAASGSTPTAGVLYVDLLARNSGNAHAIDARLEEIRLRVLEGSGAIALQPGQGPALPLRLGDLAPGASVGARLYVVVDPGVARFALEERGSTRDVSGQWLRFSSAQGVER